MANLDLLEKSIPVAPIKIAALKGCEELVVQVVMTIEGKEWPERVWRIKNGNDAPKTGEYYIIRLDVGDQPETLSLRSVLME